MIKVKEFIGNKDNPDIVPEINEFLKQNSGNIEIIDSRFKMEIYDQELKNIPIPNILFFYKEIETQKKYGIKIFNGTFEDPKIEDRVNLFFKQESINLEMEFVKYNTNIVGEMVNVNGKTGMKYKIVPSIMLLYEKNVDKNHKYGVKEFVGSTQNMQNGNNANLFLDSLSEEIWIIDIEYFTNMLSVNIKKNGAISVDKRCASSILILFKKELE